MLLRLKKHTTERAKGAKMDNKKMLYEMIANLAKIDVDQIREQTNLIDDLSFDSITIVLLIVEIETKFRIVFEDENLELAVLSSVNKLLNIINQKTSKE